MKLVIIGGSNSIIRHGYVALLKEQFPELDLVNRAVGSSSSVMGYFRLVSFDGLEPGDIVLWEYALNDEVEIAGDPAMHAALALRYVEMAMRWTIGKGARFLPVVMRPQVMADSANYSLYRRGLFDLFDCYGIDAVDANALYAEVNGGSDVPRELYKDPWHFIQGSPIPALVAEGVARQLAATDPSIQQLGPTRFGLRDGLVRVVRVFPNLPSGRYVNSLVSEVFWHPALQDTLIFEPKNKWRLLAVAVLATPHPSNFILRSAKRSIVVNLVHHHENFRKSLLRLKVLQPAQQLLIDIDKPLWMLGSASDKEVKPRDRAAPPEDSGLVGLVLERG